MRSSTTQLDPSSGALLIGGDLMHWSDLERTNVASATAYVLSRLISSHPPQSVLLLGPRAARHLDAVASSRVGVLVRGLADARQLAGLAGERDELEVICGGVERLPADRTYDLVVCLDNPATLATPDSPGAHQAGLLEQINSLIAPGGRALVSIDNTMGLDDLLRLQVRTVFDDDTRWSRGAPGFEQRSPYRHELPNLLAAAGLTVLQGYSSYPNADAPTLLIDDEVAARSTCDAPVREMLTALVQRRQAADTGRTPSLADPYAAVRKMVAARLLTDFAPCWLMVVGRADEREGRARPGLPGIIVGDDFAAPEWATVLTLDRAADGWARGAVAADGVPSKAERLVRRDLSLLTVPQPAEGDSLEEQLRVLATRGDIAGLQDAVQRYAAWLLDPAFPDPERRFFATPDNVLVEPSGSFALLDPSWSWAEQLDPQLAAVRGLRDFARRLLASGAEHRWRPDISPDDLTTTLASMADLRSDPALIDGIAQREAELAAVLQGLTALEQSRAYAANLAGGSSQSTAGPGPSRGYRESLALTGRLSQELHERGEQVEWLESSLRHRDRQLATAQRDLGAARRTLGYRAGRALGAPGRAVGRKVVNAGRSRVIAMLPPDVAPRAERALRRLLER